MYIYVCSGVHSNNGRGCQDIQNLVHLLFLWSITLHYHSSKNTQTKKWIMSASRLWLSIPNVFTHIIQIFTLQTISLDCDCFATAGDRHREWVAKQSRNSRQWFVISSHVSQRSRENFEHVQKFYATKFLAKWSQSHRECLETVANLSPTPRNLVAKILDYETFARWIRLNCEPIAT